MNWKLFRTSPRNLLIACLLLLLIVVLIDIQTQAIGINDFLNNDFGASMEFSDFVK